MAGAHSADDPRRPGRWQGAPSLLAFSLAALLSFYRGRKENDGFVGRRAKGDYPIRDEPAMLAIMAEGWALETAIGSGAAAERLMAEARLWGADLTNVGNLAAEARTAFEAIERRGVRAALEHRLAGTSA